MGREVPAGNHRLQRAYEREQYAAMAAELAGRADAQAARVVRLKAAITTKLVLEHTEE